MGVVSPVDAIREFIVSQLHWAGRMEDLTLDYPLIENHVVDSLGLFTLLAFLEQRFGIDVGDEEVVPENFGTIRAIARLVEEKRQSS